MWAKWFNHRIHFLLIVPAMDNMLQRRKISTLWILSNRLTPNIERMKDMCVASRWLAIAGFRAQHSHPNVRVGGMNAI
jgi:hypothetical protein